MKRIYEKTVKRALLSTMIVLLSMVSFSATYYISMAGNDSNSGLSSSLAWKSLSKVNGATFKGGDQILFEKGNTFYGSLTINNSGSSGSPISIGAYGTGSNPVINGFTTISGWTNLGSNIWESNNAVSTLSTCNMVSVNGVNTAMGRYPNAGYITFESHSGNTSITGSGLRGNWTGAGVVVKLARWKINKSTITSQSGSTVNYSPAMEFEPSNGFGFFIQNHPSTLDAQNEWYFNPTTKKIRIYSSSQPTNVKVASVDDLITVHGSYLTFSNLDVTGANKHGFYNSNTGISNLTIQSCSVLFSGMVGIQTLCTSAKVDNCIISDSNSEGLYYTASNAGAVITGNTFQNTGIYPGMGSNGAFTAIRLSAPESTLVQNNRIVNTGFNGIAWYNGNATVVKNNFVDTFCSVIDDGSGIYSYISQINSKIEGNIVINGIGSAEGTSTPNVKEAHGIYLDNESMNFTVTNNSVYACSGHGIMTKGTRTNISSNTVYNCGDYQLLMYLPENNQTVTNTTANNIFVCKTAGQMAVEYDYPTNSIASIGNPDNNYYARPISDNATIRVWITNGSATNYTLAAWQAYSGKDKNSRKSPQTITSENDLQFEYNATKSAKTVSLTRPMIDVKGTRYQGNITLQPYTSVVLIKDANATPAPQDLTPPIIGEFSVPTTINSLTVPISSFDATDNIGVTGYLITETSFNPSIGTKGWTALAPSNYVFSSDGSKTLYAWAKDAAGNVNNQKNSTVLVDMGPLTTVVNSSVELIKIDIFPNPSNGRVTIRFSTQPEAGSRIDILDMSGRKVASRMITEMSEEFDLYQPAGLYLVKTILNSHEIIQKLILNK